MASLNLQEKANFTRLSRLLVDKGCEALRMTFDAIHPPANLTTVLNAKKSTLLKLKSRVINFTQWDLLFPPSGNPPDSKTFDITLLTVLIRNICGLHPPATGWNIMPPNTDNSTAANITRIKLLRNEVYAHVLSTEIDNPTFETLWRQVSKTLVALKVPVKEIDDLKTCPLSSEEEIYMHKLKEWYIKDEECKDLIVDLKTDVKLIQVQHSESDLRLQEKCSELASSLQHIKKLTEENHQGIQLLSHLSTEEARNKRPSLHSIENEVCEMSKSSKELKVLQNLAKHNFESKIESKVKLFHPGTREWLFKKVESWFTKEDESRILLIKAGPGFGKSVFAAKVCEIFKESNKFAACHFCNYSDSNLKDPMMMIQSLASHMTENITGYKEKLVDQLRRPHKVNSLKDAFQIYLQNPLDEIKVEPRLIVIDGLDESATEDKSDMVNLISDHFPDLPKCVKVLITSRPEISLNTLEHIPSIEAHRVFKECDLDLLQYLKDKLPRLATRDAQNAQTKHTAIPYDGTLSIPYDGTLSIPYDGILSSIVWKCEGSFLYAFHVQKELNKRQDLENMRVEEIEPLLPKGMASIYEKYFDRLDKELEAILERKPDLYKLLELLVATISVLPLKFVARTLELDLDCRETIKIINKVNDAASCILHVSNEEVTCLHKSVHDWLLLTGDDIHQYSVTISDGKRRLWLLCEKIYQEIKSDVIAGREVKPTAEVMFSLLFGNELLMECNMKESFHWLVDMIILHVFLTFRPGYTWAFNRLFSHVLYKGDINFQLRQRISWHFTESPNMIQDRDHMFQYLKLVLDHSPQSCFTDDERETAKLLLRKCTQHVKRYSSRKKSLKPFLAKCFLYFIVAIGFTSIKKLAAVALEDGSIYVVSLPELVEIFHHQTDYENISCCIFTPDDSVVLYGRLEMGLSVSERKEISFFSGKVEAFESCAFSPNGKRLITNDGSSMVKLWDVSRKSLLLCLDAGVQLKSCSFSKTGLFIIGDSKETIKDSYCVWNAITFQRADLRRLCRKKNKTKHGLQRSEKCNRCFYKGHIELTPLKVLEISDGIYHGVECVFILDQRGFFFVVETTHHATLAAWGLPLPIFLFPTISVIATITDNFWLFSDRNNLHVFSSEETTKTQSCLSLPTVVVWCSFSPDGTRIATYTSDGFINLWYVDSCEVYERFRNSGDILSGACWWSKECLFVCHLQDGVPNLSKYPVDEKFDIKITQNISVSLLSIISDFLPLSGIQDFSEGYISFTCDEISPVKVVNVDKMEYPAMVSLPEITRTISIAVSPGASLILGCDVKEHDVIFWKRIDADPISYLVHWKLPSYIESYSPWCFSEDLKFAFLYLPRSYIWIRADLVEKVCQKVSDKNGYIPVSRVPTKAFSTKGVMVIVTSKLIDIVDLMQFKCVGFNALRNIEEESVLKSKLSPNGNILAVPTVTGDMDFFEIRP